MKRTWRRADLHFKNCISRGQKIWKTTYSGQKLGKMGPKSVRPQHSLRGVYST